MLTKGSRKDAASTAPQDRPLQEQPATDADTADVAIDHGHPSRFDHRPGTTGDPYNTTGRFTLEDNHAPAVPVVPKIIPRR
jgi:hypothetical protein